MVECRDLEFVSNLLNWSDVLEIVAVSSFLEALGGGVGIEKLGL